MNAVLIALAAGLCWGIGEVFTKSVLHGRQIGPLTAIAVRSTVALPLMWLVYLWYVHLRAAEPRNWPHADPATLSKLVLGSGVIAGAAGMILFYLALSVGEISKVKPVAFTVAPATAVVLGWLALGESMSLSQATGVLLVLAGVALLASR